MSIEERYYWSPSVFWKLVDNMLEIEMFMYEDFIPSLFPKFYFLTQDGICIVNLIHEFPEVNPKKLKFFILDLIKKNILINRLLTPQEVFYTQGRMYKSDYGDELQFDIEAIKLFKKIQLNRMLNVNETEKVELLCDADYPKTILDRRSWRRFDENKIISFRSFSKMISVLRQTRNENEITYYYASAGGLYPIDIFIYVQKDRVEQLEQGIYYYCPITNYIYLVNEKAHIDQKAHLFFNKDIFQSSAFSIYMFYDADVSMPKYSGNAYFYACIDIGIMVSTLNQVAETVDIGMCSIGEMDFEEVRSNFRLNSNHIHMHTIEAGVKF
jgi:SagB-type dehydrogenase family enzyme